MKLSLIIPAVIIFLIFLTVLELSKNTVLGWILAAAVLAAFFIVNATVLRGGAWYFKALAWAAFIALLGADLWLTQPPIRAVPAADHKNPVETGIVTVAEGDLTGVYSEDKAVELYMGVPYAKPPVGELRWKAPQDAEKWQGVRRCDTYAPQAMQGRTPALMGSLVDIFIYKQYQVTLKDNFLAPMSEDCLYLNIWKPAGEIKDAPVLVFIHGGSLNSGQTWWSEYNGEALARRGIVVVNFAYRLGVFGYMGHPELLDEAGSTGNYGLLDQIKALEWVQKNIGAFGGDKNNVTLAGESAGSSSVSALCVSPLAKGLFRRAIGESSSVAGVKPYHTFRSLDAALKGGEDVQKEFNCASLAEMRSIPAEKLVGTQFTPSAMTVDGYALREQPYLTYERGEQNEEALLNGYNKNESIVFSFFYKVDEADLAKNIEPLFGEFSEEAAKLLPIEEVKAPYKYIVDQGGSAKGTFDKLLTAAWFSYSHYSWSRLDAKAGIPVWEYYFTKDNGSMGSNHGGEMPYCYGNLNRHAWLYDESDFALENTMLTYWENFCRYGDPNGAGVPEWKKFNEDETKILELGDNVGMVEDPFLEVYNVIDKYQNTQR